MTYAQAKEKIIGLAASIYQLEGENIGLMLYSNIKTILLFYAILLTGKNVVIIDPFWGEESINNVLKATEIKSVLSTMPPEQKILLQLYTNPEINKQPYQSICRDHSSKIIVFTSGTTSAPKGVVLSQQALVYAYQLGLKCLEIDQSYSSGCFYRISGLGILGINFLFMHMAGGTGNILPEFSYTNEQSLGQYVKRYNIRFLYLVPPIVNYMINYYTENARDWLGSILKVSSAAMLSKQNQNIFQEKFSGLANIYGLTECGFAFLFGEKQGKVFSNSVGKAKGLLIKLLDNDGNEIHQPHVKGHLYVKTNSVFEGYYKNEVKTKEILSDDWLNSKDIAYFDEAKCFYLIGRVDDTINKAGNLFHLSEADEFFLNLPGTIDACSLKISCNYYGEDYIMCLYVKPDADVSRHKVLAEKNLGIYRAPKKILYLNSEIPRNGAGKYNRNELTKLIQHLL
jgi:acyl-CoA synthetase (AMP-forming)/AMP-acid ligase II